MWKWLIGAVVLWYVWHKFRDVDDVAYHYIDDKVRGYLPKPPQP